MAVSALHDAKTGAPALELNDRLERRRRIVWLTDRPRCRCGRRATQLVERAGRIVGTECRACHGVSDG